MHWYNKIAWSEGQFLRPQLFQQQERYLEQYAHRRAALAGPFFWGFSQYEIDGHGLSLGHVGLTLAAGILPDGTPFKAPGETLVPTPLAVRQEHSGQLLCLAVQASMPGTEETSFDAPLRQAASLARFGVFDADVDDSNSISQGPKPVQLSRLRLRVMLATDAEGGWASLPFARVERVCSDGSVELDAGFVPPVCGYSASPQLVSWFKDLHSTLHLRAGALAARLSASDGRTHESAEVADYLLLQILNRADAALRHLLTIAVTPPETFYRLLLGLGAELSTFVRTDTRVPPLHPAYRHIALADSFTALVADTRILLNEVLVRSARQIPLEERPDKVRVAHAGPADLKGFSSLVFAVAAEMPADRLATEFPQHCKVGPSDRLADLIRTHVPGIALQLLPVPPRQIPFHAGYLYFQLDTHGPLWAHLLQHGGIGLHIGTVFPGLRLEFWGVSKK